MPFKSKAQQRWMFAAEDRGELPEGTARRWARHTKSIKRLPEHVEKRAFVEGFEKTAVIDLSEQARQETLRPMQEFVPGRSLPKDTAQPRGRVARTPEVLNEDREFKPALRHRWENARQPSRRGDQE